MASAKQNGGIILAIIKANYAATEDQVEQLGHVVHIGEQADLMYFRVVLAHMQSRLGNVRRGRRMPEQEPVLDAVHEQMYAAALRGVGGQEEIDSTERNRRGTKFRTAASTIRFAIRAGVDIRTVDVATATKSGLRTLAKPQTTKAPEGASRQLRGFISAAEGLKRSASRLARGDPDTAREQLEQLMDDLDKLLESIGQEPAAATADVGGQTTTIVGRPAGRAPTRAPQLHQGA